MTSPRDMKGDDATTPLVPFVPFRCPSCQRHKPFTYAVRDRIRYHRCQSCGTKYRSLELDASSVRDFKADPHSGRVP